MDRKGAVFQYRSFRFGIPEGYIPEDNFRILAGNSGSVGLYHRFHFYKFPYILQLRRIFGKLVDAVTKRSKVLTELCQQGNIVSHIPYLHLTGNQFCHRNDIHDPFIQCQKQQRYAMDNRGFHIFCPKHPVPMAPYILIQRQKIVFQGIQYDLLMSFSEKQIFIVFHLSSAKSLFFLKPVIQGVYFSISQYRRNAEQDYNRNTPPSQR